MSSVVFCQINKDTIYKEAPIYPCFFLNDVMSFLKNFVKEDMHSSKDTSHKKCILSQHGNIFKIIHFC